MTREEFDGFCVCLASAIHVIQWGDASVWKVGGKVFAIGGWSESSEFAVTFKCTETSFAMLKDLPGLRPAPYLASRGLDRKSTRLNSSHVSISYAVFCLKKK